MIDRFTTESNLQGNLSKEFFPLISLLQLSMHLRNLHQINTRNTHLTEYLRLYSLIQLIHYTNNRMKLCWCWKNIWSFIQDLHPGLYLTCWPSVWVLIIWVDRSVEVKFTWSSLGWIKSLVTAVFSW